MLDKVLQLTGILAILITPPAFSYTLGGWLQEEREFKIWMFNETVRETSFIADIHDIEYFPYDDWRLVGQREINVSRFSSASVAIVFKSKEPLPATAVILNETTILAPGVEYDGESRIWFLGYLWEFVPRKPIHPSRLTVKFNYTFLDIKANIPAPSVPLHNTNTSVAMTQTTPPFGTKCQIFGFLQGPDFDLHRIGATVLKGSRCQDIFQNIGTKLSPCFCTELEALDPMGGGEVGINQPYFDARVRDRRTWNNIRRGDLVKIDQRYPIFCENWVNSTSEVYVFAGFSIHHIVQGSVRFFMFENIL